MSDPLKVFIIAGEPSGDALGGDVMAGLKELCPNITFQGIGGSNMQGQGLESLFDMSELSVMGLAEILPKYRHLKRRISQTAQAAIAAAPDVILTIDSPDFCLRVAKLVKAQRDIHVVHYVAPSVWAWRPKRAQKMARHVDQVLALLPFEPPFMQAAGMQCDFVGHPVANTAQASRQDCAAFRMRHQIAEDAPLVLVLPGSRGGEVRRLSDVFGEALAHFQQTHSNARFVLPVAPSVRGLVTELTANWSVKPILIDSADQPEKLSAFGAANIALAASGTVSLELAAAQTPMVIAYKMNWLTAAIMRRLMRVDTVTLVNLVSETRVVPEFLMKNCTAEAVAQGLSTLFAKPATQSAALDITMDRLGRGQERAGLRAARAILSGINKSVG
ncbi:lipid-A-disaccharide synthase [Nereida sp. NH-UV-3]|uniref:lipid-A-disaccharide synthase n=1 Tax=Nereida TaxID=282198 RepID=UPI0036F2452F